LHARRQEFRLPPVELILTTRLAAALYFSTFDPEQLAFRISQILDDDSLAHRLADQGRERARSFRWPNHFDRLTELIDQSLALSKRIESYA
jgi:glycosyltransferase involved in cell wall biosynthesis